MSATESSYLHIPTIPSDFIRQMVAHLDIEPYSNLNLPQQLQQLLAQTKVSIAQYSDFHLRLRQALDDEMLGLLPKPVPLGSQKVLCQMLRHSPDLITALEHYNRFYSLFLDAGQSLLDLSQLRENHCISLLLSSPLSHQAMYQQSVFLALLKIPAWLAGKKLPVAGLTFDFTAMPFDNEFSYLYGIVPQYDCGQTRLQFAEGSLSYPIQPQLGAEDFGDQYILHSLYWSANDDIVHRVYGEISRRLASADFDVVNIAASLNTSKHTLARRLKASASSYGQILERVRRDKALHLLLNSHASVDDIAGQLGFKELGSFSRAFKAWTDYSPSQYRDNTL